MFESVVWVLNKPQGKLEKQEYQYDIFKKTSMLKKARLLISLDKIDLSYTRKGGIRERLGTILFSDIVSISVAPYKLKLFHQLILPIMTGLIFWIFMIISGFISARLNASQVSISTGFMLLPAIIILFIIINLRKIAWSNLSIIIIESTNGTNISFGVNDRTLDSLSNYKYYVEGKEHYFKINSVN